MHCLSVVNKDKRIFRQSFCSLSGRRQCEQVCLIYQKIHVNTKAPLYGLVVCGGKSSRMGFDKSLISYHNIPQRYHLYHMLQAFCEKVFISCNRNQISSVLSGYNTIVDAEGTEDTGPIAALVSAFAQFPTASFLVVGCDYPFLQHHDIEKLVSARKSHHMTICFLNSSGFEEPLIAIYEAAVQKKLMETFHHGKYSLRRLLQSVNTLHCSAISEFNITSVDDRKTFDELRN